MPKQTFTINDFSGGANGYVDPLDIADNELAQCQGFKIEPGVVSVLGHMTYVDASNGSYTIGTGDEEGSASDIDIEPGYGLFSFAHDYNMKGGASDAGTDVELENTSYFVMLAVSSGDKHNKLDIYDTTAHTWRPDMVDLGASASNADMPSIKPCFFVADGAFRVSPGDFTIVDSGEDATATLPSVDTNYGGVTGLTMAVDSTEYLTVGDTITVNKQEMICLTVGDGGGSGTVGGNYFARNMTGLFPSAVTNTTPDKIIYHTPDTRWRGVVSRRNFSQAGDAGSFEEWYSTYAHPRPPATYSAVLDAGAVSTQYTFPFLVNCTGYDSGDVTAGDATTTGAIPPVLWIVYRADNTDDDATWDGASVNLYCTALYDEVKQESQPNKVASSVSIAAGKSLGVGITVNYADADVSGGAYQINKRVTGARIYYEDTAGDPGILYQLLEIDFEHGCKKAEAENFSTWVDHGSLDDEIVQCPTVNAHDSSALDDTTDAFMFPDPPKAFTYEINTLYPPNVNTHARYKTAVIANRRLFAGNVYQSGKANGDRMLQSPVNKFDILPEYGDFVIDVTKGDGDSIVKLEAYADRVLQFKKRTLYIINVGSAEIGEEFIESTHKNMGVQNPSQTCMTEYGVTWVNRNGVFLYDGQEITDLTMNKLQMTNTTDRTRALNIDEDNIPLIGYHPLNKWLIIHPQSTIADSNDVEAWIHDFKNGSWTYSNTFSTTDYYKTNMIWTVDNELVFASGTNAAKPLFIKYRDPSIDSPIGKLLFLTKEFHLDAPGVKKKLRSVYITYSASANTKIEADLIYKSKTGTATDDLTEADSGSTYYTEADGFLSTSGNVRTVELVPTTYSTNAYTFQLKLHNPDAAYPYGADFKLYNISFAYRPLGVR